MPVSRSRYLPLEKSKGFPAASVTTPPASAKWVDRLARELRNEGQLQSIGLPLTSKTKGLRPIGLTRRAGPTEEIRS